MSVVVFATENDIRVSSSKSDETFGMDFFYSLFFT